MTKLAVGTLTLLLVVLLSVLSVWTGPDLLNRLSSWWRTREQVGTDVGVDGKLGHVRVEVQDRQGETGEAIAVRHGLYREYAKDGALSVSGFFEEGFEVGVWTYWTANSIVRQKRYDPSKANFDFSGSRHDQLPVETKTSPPWWPVATR